MNERTGGWSSLSSEERSRVLDLMKNSPEAVAALVDAAQTGDTVAAEAILAFGQIIVIEDTARPEETQSLPHQSSNE